MRAAFLLIAFRSKAVIRKFGQRTSRACVLREFFGWIWAKQGRPRILARDSDQKIRAKKFEFQPFLMNGVSGDERERLLGAILIRSPAGTARWKIGKKRTWKGKLANTQRSSGAAMENRLVNRSPTPLLECSQTECWRQIEEMAWMAIKVPERKD